VSELNSDFLDSTRLLFELQQGNEIAQSLSGCLEPEAIARQVTEGLVEKFGCAFARIWIVEPDRTLLRLVSSSGMYTRLDGAFARVPMGAFKVGKIAQHCIPFLSNQLPEETWVKDREWAIAHKIRGFAGYPLAANGRVVGVLAVFSQQVMQPEFLEVLQGLCTTVTVALENALRYQQEKQRIPQASTRVPLSEQLSDLLQTRLVLVGTERSLTTPSVNLFLRATELLSQKQCIYCRLTYGDDRISLEAMMSGESRSLRDTREGSLETISAFDELLFVSSCLGGSLSIHTVNPKAIQVLLTVPYPNCALGSRVRVDCRSSVLQLAFTHLAYLAGLSVSTLSDLAIPLVTDDIEQIHSSDCVLWIVAGHPTPKDVKANLDLSISPGQLREAIESVLRGETWGIEPQDSQSLSDREQEIMTRLAQGMRDREIANELHISESTIKFHMNNVLTKLKAKTRYQALYQAIVHHWI
jgi:GAF domain-containing protein/DNA-binding CsgD family transcriptional regulator